MGLLYLTFYLLPIEAARLLGESFTGDIEINWWSLHIIFLFYYGNY
jgi:hypothetical protein